MQTRARSGTETGHIDTFAADHLPPREFWPILDFTGIPELAYPPRLNCAVELLDRNVASGLGHRPALRFPDGIWTYAELLAHANRIARVLVEDLGVVPGNRVLLRGPNHPLLAATWFAVLKAGAICVTTMPLLRPRELTAICDKARVSLALTDTRFGDDIERTAASSEFLKRVIHFNTRDTGSLDALAADKPPTFDAVDTAADDVAIIAFTSGTTGTPKGTLHVHRDILAICDCFPKYVLRPTAGDVFCGSPPFAFTFGLGGLLLFPMRAGASTLLIEDASPPRLIEAIAEYGATVSFTAPTAYRAMASKCSDFDLRSLRKCVSAGETLPEATFSMWERATGIRIIDGIGATELLHIFISSPESEARPGSTGRVVPGYRARILDPDGNDVEPGEIGRLAVVGPTGCRYLDDIERQRGYVQSGWNLTGDAYTMDDAGYFWYKARTDDMIISSGYNIAGPEVENVLLEHPAVHECGVIGLPDEQRGQIVTAFVVLHASHQRNDVMVKMLQDHVKQSIAPYKYPRRVVFLDRLPRTDTGKLQRFRLREEYSQ